MHRYCRLLLKGMLKRVIPLHRYTVHRHKSRSDSWLFSYRGYRKIVTGCCCVYYAAFSGFASWLERNYHHKIEKQIKTDVKKSLKLNAK